MECLWLLLIELLGFYFLSFDSSSNPFLQNSFLFLFEFSCCCVEPSKFWDLGTRVWRVSAFDFLSPWVSLSFSEKLGLKPILDSRQNKTFILSLLGFLWNGELSCLFLSLKQKSHVFLTNWVVGVVWCLRFQIPCLVRVLLVKELKLNLL